MRQELCRFIRLQALSVQTGPVERIQIRHMHFPVLFKEADVEPAYGTVVDRDIGKLPHTSDRAWQFIQMDMILPRLPDPIEAQHFPAGFSPAGVLQVNSDTASIKAENMLLFIE